ncbi:hypothetical protein CC2G_005990 [Coprinopsis cinerea AmutBmut pab1-1]|nr:hypothetical protein CC2G_005990 [Coprinopsis cinerea AmutBmut pab1-1]
MARQVYILWDESASPKASLGGYTVVAAIRTFASRLGVIKAVKYYADISTNSKARILPGLASELQCSGVSVIDTVSGGREGASSKMMLADCFILALDNPDPSKFVLVVITADPDTCYSISSLRLRGYCVPVICPLNTDVNIARLSDLRTLGVSACNTLSEIAANVRAMLDTVTESQSPSSNERSQSLTCQSYSPVQPHRRDLEDKSPQGNVSQSPVQPTWSTSPFAVPQREDDEPSIVPSTSTTMHQQPASSTTETLLRDAVSSPSTSIPEAPAARYPALSPLRSTATPFSPPQHLTAPFSRPTSSNTAVDRELQSVPSRTSEDEHPGEAPATIANPTPRAWNCGPVYPPKFNFTGPPTTSDWQKVWNISSETFVGSSATTAITTTTAREREAGIPAHFRVLVEVLREQRSKGISVMQRCALTKPLQNRDPKVFVRAGTSQFKRPIKQYLQEAEKLGIVTIAKGGKTKLAPAWY